MRRWIRIIARLYPSAWRARYGDEYEVLLEQMKPGWRDVLDVLRGAMDMQARSWTFARTVAAVGLAGMIVAGVIAMRMPGQYVSSGVLKIHGGVDAGTLAALLPQGLTRGFLVEVMQKRNLYREERIRHPMEDVVELMRHNIVLTPLEQKESGERTVLVRFAYPEASLAQSTNNDLLRRLRDVQTKLQGAADVAAPASLPSDAISPNRGSIILCGLLVGLLAGAIGASLRHKPGWTLRVAAVALTTMLVATAASFAIPNRYVSSGVFRVDPAIAKLLRNHEARMRPNLTVTQLASGAGHDVLQIAFRDRDRHQAQKTIRELISDVVIEYAGRLQPLEGTRTEREFRAWRATPLDFFEMIDAPILPEEPIWPNRLVIAAIALVLGALLGAYMWRRARGLVAEPAR